MQPEGNWITRAPSLRRKAILLAKVQDEAGHGLYLYAAAETLGVGPGRPDRAADQRQAEVLVDLQLPDAEFRRCRCHRLAGGRVRDLQPGPAVPQLLRAVRPRDDPHLQGGVFHQRQGYELLMTMMRGTDAQRAMVQDAVDRWWWPSLMMFGPPDDVSPNTARSMAWKIKRHTQRRAAAAVRRHDRAAGRGAGRHAARPGAEVERRARALRLRTGRLGRVQAASSAGHGPCNAQRIAQRRKAHDDGAWVREAAAAHAAKQSARETGRHERRDRRGRAWRGSLATRQPGRRQSRSAVTGRCTRCSCGASGG